MSDAVKLKVSTEVLLSRSEDIERHLSALLEDINELNASIESTASYWIGDGGEKRRNAYERKKIELEQCLLRAKEYPEDLLKMAGIYTKAEQTVTETSQSLANNIIL